MKKIYSIDVHYEVKVPATVEAETREEAIKKAIDSLSDCDLNEGNVIDEFGVINDAEVIDDDPSGDCGDAYGSEEEQPNDDETLKDCKDCEDAKNPSTIEDLIKEYGNGLCGMVCTSPDDLKRAYDFLSLLFGKK